MNEVRQINIVNKSAPIDASTKVDIVNLSNNPMYKDVKIVFDEDGQIHIFNSKYHISYREIPGYTEPPVPIPPENFNPGGYGSIY